MQLYGETAPIKKRRYDELCSAETEQEIQEIASDLFSSGVDADLIVEHMARRLGELGYKSPPDKAWGIFAAVRQSISGF